MLPVLISQDLWERRYGADPRSSDVASTSTTARASSSASSRAHSTSRRRRSTSGIRRRCPSRQPQITARGLTVIGRLRDGVTVAPGAGGAEYARPARSRRAFRRSPGPAAAQPRARLGRVAQVRDHRAGAGAARSSRRARRRHSSHRDDERRQPLPAAHRAHEPRDRHRAVARRNRVALAQRFVIEGVVLGLASGIVAIPAAALALSTKFGFTDREIPRLHEVSFTVGDRRARRRRAPRSSAPRSDSSRLTRTGVAGLFDRLRATRATSSRGWRRAQNGLVAFQVAIALTLLVAAALLGRSFWNLRNARSGSSPRTR